MADLAPDPLPPNNSLAPVFLSILWVTLSPAIIVVSMRVYTTVIHRKIHWDDGLIVVGLALAIYGAVLCHLQVNNGYGRHIYYLSDHQISQMLKWSTLAEIENEIGIVFVKTSICLFILRIVSGTKRIVRTVIWFTIIIFFIATAVGIITIAAQCRPFNAIWDKSLPSHCISPSIVSKVTRAYAVLSVITDFITASLPIFVIQGLQMNKQTKIALCGIMGLGFFTAATSIGKTVTTNFVSADFSWDLVQVEIWAILEQQIGIIVASMPALRQLFLWSRRRSDSHPSDRSNYALAHPTELNRLGKSNAQDKTSTSEENLFPVGNMTVRKTTEYRVDVSASSINENQLEAGHYTTWDGHPTLRGKAISS